MYLYLICLFASATSNLEKQTAARLQAEHASGSDGERGSSKLDSRPIEHPIAFVLPFVQRQRSLTIANLPDFCLCRERVSQCSAALAVRFNQELPDRSSAEQGGKPHFILGHLADQAGTISPPLQSGRSRTE